jgi:CBS-domain-containing membrane protein
MSILHSPHKSLRNSTLSAIGIFISLCACGYISELSGYPLLIAAFGATSMTMIGMSHTPVAQPINVFGGYLIATLVVLGSDYFLPHEIWSLALCTAIASLLMFRLRLTHPPAAGIPIIMYFRQPEPDFYFLLFPVMAGALLLVVIGIIYNKIADEYRN